MNTFQKITLALLTMLGANMQLNAATTLYIDVAEGESATVSGALTANIAYKTSNGTAVLSGANIFTNLEIQDGTISVAAVGPLGGGLVVFNGATNPTLLTTASMNTGALVLTTPGILNVQGAATVATLSETPTGVSALTKAGTGILDIAADRSGSAIPVTVSEGTLRVGGAGKTTTGAHSISSGGTLLLYAGITPEAVAATTVASGGTLEVGANVTVPAAVGAVDFFSGALTMQSGSILKLGNNSNWDRALTVGAAL
jgi:hypothetical protein